MKESESTSSSGASPSSQAFGRHAPGSASRFLRLIIDSGLSHGKISKLVLNKWINDHGPIVDAEIDGIKYRLDLSDNATDIKIFISSKRYDKAEIDALAKAANGRWFVDIGANTGYYTMNLLRRGAKKVLAIEPNPPTLDRLEFNLAINRMTDRVALLPEGVGPAGELEFFQTAGLGSASFVRPAGDVPSIKVRTRPLLDILAEQGITSIGALKIDVEGFEDRVLGPFVAEAPEALLPKCIVMEACHDDDWETDLAKLLVAQGYRLDKRTRANYIFTR